MSDDGTQFAVHYAIEKPDGQILRAQTPVGEGEILLWNNRDYAEQYMQRIVNGSLHFGVTWTGRIVWQYCTPFVGQGDPAGDLINELSEWLKRNGGN